MPRPSSEWFQGQYKVLAGVERLEQRPRPAPGEIIRHKGGAVVIMRCPACEAIQFFVAKISGRDDAPTLSKPVKCSAGSCRDCGVWFRVVEGRVGSVEPPVAGERHVDPRLARRLKRPSKVGA
jgi:hypothetical protein